MASQNAYFAKQLQNFRVRFQKVLMKFVFLFQNSCTMSDLQHYLSQRSLKFKLHIKKSTNPSSKSSQEKSKQINKYRLKQCHPKCQKHRFSLVRLDRNKDRHKFILDKFEVTYNFCPYHNELINAHEGGTLHFNKDRCIETPAFLLKSEISIDNDEVYKEIFKDVLARATNQTLVSSNEKGRIDCDKRLQSKGKSNDFQNKVLELKNVLTKKDELNKQECKSQK